MTAPVPGCFWLLRGRDWELGVSVGVLDDPGAEWGGGSVAAA
jgi:hypothetical protein